MKGENSDGGKGIPPYSQSGSFFAVFSLTVLYVFSALSGVFLYLQYREVKDLQFRVISLERERALFGFKAHGEALLTQVRRII